MRFWTILAMLWLAFAAQPLEAKAPFSRGISIHTMLNWARLEPNDPSHYAADPFSGPDYELPDVLIRRIKSTGFDFVRLTIDPGPFLQFHEERRPDLERALERKMATTVRGFLRADLAVVVDLHSNTHVPAYDPVNWLTSTENPTFKQYVGLVGRLARVLSTMRSRSVAIEPMNEPLYGYDPRSVARWQKMAEEMHAAVRKADPDLLVVLSGAQGGSRNGLADFDPEPFRGSRVLFSFHYYEPYVFTHEGVVSNDKNSALWRYFSSLPYPVGRVPEAKVFATIRQNVYEDSSLNALQRAIAWRRARGQVADYLASGFGPRSIDEAFDRVVAWTRRHSVEPSQIFLGEFGVTRTYGSYRAADPQSRFNWLRDVRTAAEKRDFGWCLWELRGYGGMALVSEDGGTELDGLTLRALGLNAHSGRSRVLRLEDGEL